MHPILKIVHYLFKKNNIEITDETFNSFFDGGIDFPQFVAIAFNKSEIPHINKNPKLIFHRNVNNNTALQYLYEHNPEIARISPNFSTDQDKANLLTLILIKQCFSLNIPLIINKYNLIVKPLGINCTKKNDLINAQSFINLLNILTDGKVQIDTEIADFDSTMKQIFDIAKAPLVINKSSLEFQNQFLFLIQFEILFDFYDDKIKQIIEKESNTNNPDSQKEIETLKENEKQKQLAKEKEIEMQKEIENQKEIEKLKRLEKQKEIGSKQEENPKELEQKEIERRHEIEEQMKLQKQIELEEQKNKCDSDLSQALIDDDNKTQFSDFEEINDENASKSEIDDSSSSVSDAEDKKYTDSDEEIDKSDVDMSKISFSLNSFSEDSKLTLESSLDEKPQNDENHENDLKAQNDESIEIDLKTQNDVKLGNDVKPQNDENEKRKRKSNLTSKFHNSDMKSFDFSSPEGSKSTFNDIKKADSYSDSDSSFEVDEAIEVRNYDSDEYEYDNEQKEKSSVKEPGRKRKKHRKRHRFLSKHKKEIKSGKLESVDDDKLLEIINAIEYKSYKNFYQAIENDGIPKFVMRVLNHKSIKNVIISKNEHKSKNTNEYLTKHEIKNIKATIDYLSKKEPKFKILLFDFSNSIYVESSAILFYRTFISFFFLKSSKKKLFERCVNLLSHAFQKKDLKNEKKVLTNWNTYVYLGSFLCNKSLRFDPNFDVQTYFMKVAIPVIVDKSFLLRLINHDKMPISIYCQLQFIFDRIDKPGNSYHIIEILNKAMRAIKMKVPKPDDLASSIRAKNISLILQKKEYKSYVIQKQIYESIEGYGHEDEDKENDSNKIKMPTPPVPFNEREHIIDIVNSIKTFRQSLQKVQSPDTFWNPPDFSYSFENGILFKKAIHKKRKNQSQSDWDTEMANIQAGVSKKITINETIQTKPLQKATLYKFFIYNADLKKWELNINFFDLFVNDKNINNNEMKTPLILFLNSNEDDLKNIAINSKILIDDFPDLSKENEIFVYGFGDIIYTKPKPVPKPQKKMQEIEIENETINPIFLFLHVPLKLAKMPNISTVIYSIYTFLCFICDIEIIILNNNFYEDQIDIIKSINLIANSYKETYQNEPDSIFSIKTISELHLLSPSNSSDDENDVIDDFNFDECDSNDEINNEEDENEIQNKYLNFSEISSKVFLKKRKIVVLCNDENDLNSNEMISKFNNSSFFSSKISEIDPQCKIHYINVKDLNSYGPFITEIKGMSLADDVSNFGEVAQNFNFTQLTEISSKYIKLKNDKKWEELLNKAIRDRYSTLGKADTLNSQYITILANLREEISKMSPPLDILFKNKCDGILQEIKKIQSLDNLSNFVDEIENSSELNMNYIKEIINNEKMWQEIDKDGLKNSHIKFLKEEFLNIIKMFYPDDLFRSIYEEYKDVLYDQIKKDLDVIDKWFIAFTQKQALNQINKRGEIKKLNQIKNKAKRGTNYAIREVENTREIKVTVQVDSDLTSEINQDF